MKIALISDIHGNYTALKAVINDIENEKVDTIVCLGDVATLGPQPLQVIQTLKILDCAFILGNHDETLLKPEEAANLQIAPPLISTLNWCRQQLKQDDYDFLKSFKPSHENTLSTNDNLFCYHGSPQSNIKNFLATTPESEMDQIYSQIESSIFVGGHTHIQMLRQHNGKLFINPGSVGMPFHHTPLPGEQPRLLPFAEYAIIDLKGEDSRVDLRRVTFDIEEYKEAITKSDLPIREWLLKKYN